MRRPYTVEYRVQLPEGRLRHAITTAQPVFDEHGAFTHYIGTVLDISDLKQACSSLARKEEVLRNLIEAQEYEKQAIGHDIHDGLLQYAIGSRMLLESLVHEHGGMSGLDVIETVLGYLGKGIEEGRQVVRGMRPPSSTTWASPRHSRTLPTSSLAWACMSSAGSTRIWPRFPHRSRPPFTVSRRSRSATCGSTAAATGRECHCSKLRGSCGWRWRITAGDSTSPRAGRGGSGSSA